MSSKDPTEKLLFELDGIIDKRDMKLSIIDQDYVDEDGKVLSRDYDNYQRRRETVLRRFEKEALDIQYELDACCKEIRKHQPELQHLTAENIRKDQRFPNVLALDKIRVTYSSLDFYVPRTVPFPFPHNIAIARNDANECITRLILRMLYTIPCGKIALHIFDPVNLGYSVSSLKALLTEDKIIPEKKILSSKKEIRECLEAALSHAENLIQTVFPAGCNSYAQYNKIQKQNNELKNTLPYHVYLLFDVPHNLDEPSMEMLQTLSGLSERCGHLVIITYDPAHLQEADQEGHAITFDKTIQYLKKLIAQSDGSEFFSGLHISGLRHLKTAYAPESLPSEADLLNRMGDLKKAYDEFSKTGTSFMDLTAGRKIFDSTSERELIIPVGFSVVDNNILNMLVGDNPPHYIIGGETSSGKSNFLHVLILSMCLRYSPQELELYLLDFKDGVEFKAYANPLLPHARLVAVKADTEYGVSVLDYLIAEKERRNQEFNRHVGINDIKHYRDQNLGVMPRIVVIIDEFQVLFTSEDKDKTVAGLNMLAKQGRSCGIHLILATQSLADVNFSDTQFGGRIALPCPPEDSKLLMGGIITNNEAASELKKGFAILNTEHGRVSGNRKFAIPNVKDNFSIRAVVEEIVEQSKQMGFPVKTEVFLGQELPKHPEVKAFACTTAIRLQLGKTIEFPSRIFSIELRSKGGENVAICGSDDVFRDGLMLSVLMSAVGCTLIKQIVCIGSCSRYADMISGKSVACFPNSMAWVRKSMNTGVEAGTLVLMDGVNLKKELNFDPYDPTPEGTFFQAFLSEAGKTSCHIIAFYERFKEFDSCGLDIEHFIHRIAFGLSNADLGRFTGAYNAPGHQTSRALYSCDGKIQGFFKPYGEVKNG